MAAASGPRFPTRNPVTAVGPKGVKSKVRPLPPEDEEGFVDSLRADGSMHPCKVRMGLASDAWLCCDVIVPPSSFNGSETLNEGTTLLMRVFEGAQGGLTAILNGREISLASGDNMTILPESQYQLRNDSETANARVKMVMLTPQAAA